MNKLFLLWMAALWAGCQLDATQCMQQSDCFVGEQCAQQRCVAAVVIEPDCSPLDCASELTAQTECVAQRCVVRSCAQGAALCKTGCCPATEPTPADELLPVTQVMPLVRRDTAGNAHLWSQQAAGDVLCDLSWDGLRWSERLESPFPEPLGAYDLRYDAQGDVHIAYTTKDGSLWYARREQDGAWRSEQVAARPAQTVSSDLLFMRPTLSLEPFPSVAFLYGNAELANGTKTRAGYPQAWFASRATGEWSAERLAVEDAALHTIAYKSVLAGQGLLALTLYSSQRPKIVIMSRDLSTAPWKVHPGLSALFNGLDQSYFTESGGMTRDAAGDTRLLFVSREAGDVAIRELLVPATGQPSIRDIIRRAVSNSSALFAPSYMDGAEPAQIQLLDYDINAGTGSALRSITLEPLVLESIPDLVTRGLWWGIPRADKLDIFYQNGTHYSYVSVER
jgi:hypothetical protein